MPTPPLFVWKLKFVLKITWLMFPLLLSCSSCFLRAFNATEQSTVGASLFVNQLLTLNFTGVPAVAVPVVPNPVT